MKQHLRSEYTHKVGKLINQFEAQGKSIADFNALFLGAPIEGMQPEFEVEIGDITRATFFRTLHITRQDGTCVEIEHDFRPLTGDQDESEKRR